jgi:hypothetical protein
MRWGSGSPGYLLRRGLSALDDARPNDSMVLVLTDLFLPLPLRLGVGGGIGMGSSGRTMGGWMEG